MKISYLALFASVTWAITGCGGGGDDQPSGPRYVSEIAIPNAGAATNYSFDIGTTVGSSYYFTDRNNAAIQAIDIPSLTLVGSISGSGSTAFTGQKASNALSGPDGINAVGPLLYAGDVNSVKIADPVSKTIVKSIVVSTTGVRADEGCVDATHNLYMIASPEEPTPFATFINTTTQTIVARVTFTDNKGAPSAGLEGCRYDASTDSFYINNDGSTDNPHGELVKLPGAAIRGIAAGSTANYTDLAGLGIFAEGNCDPTGLAAGPGTDIAIGCREGTTGAPLLVLIMNRNTGSIVASLNAGGGDELTYDSTTNRYYSAASRWTANGTAAVNGTCSAASPCTPVLAIIDATSRTIVAQLPSGNNAHSVAVDPVSGLIFMPTSSAVAPAGCGTCVANGFVNAGVLVYKAM